MKSETRLEVPPEKDRPQLRPYDYKIGMLDNDDVKVEKIYAKFQGYVVYRTRNAIRVDFLDSDVDSKKHINNHLKIGVQLAGLYSLLPENLRQTESINRLVARAMVLNISGSYHDSLIVLQQAESRLVKLRIVNGRLQYTASAFCLVSLIGIPYATLKICTKLIALNKHIGFCSFAPDLQILEVMFLGAIGGLLSITVSYGNLKIDVDANTTTNFLIGASRIVIAVIAAIFIYLAIKANLIFSFVNDRKDSFGFLAFAMVAGFVEMLVPKIMNNLGNDVKNTIKDNEKQSSNSITINKNVSQLQDQSAFTPVPESNKAQI